MFQAALLETMKTALACRRRCQPRGRIARLAACYAQLERTAEAQAAVAEVLRLQPDFSTAEYMRKSVLLEQSRGPGASPRRARQGRIAGVTWFARPQQVLSSSLASFCRPA